MTKREPLPPHLAELLPTGPVTERTLAVPLPAGRTVLPDEGYGPTPVMWMSEGPAPAGLWPELHAAHRSSGLWPLLLADLHHDSEEFRPWGSGELFPAGKSRPGDHNPQEFLAAAWTWAGGEGDLASYVRSQGGPPTARAIPVADADACAVGYAESLLRKHPRMRIGLVPAGRGADTLTAVGWEGPVNYFNDTAKISAVLRDWEDRFGARVVAVGFADLYLSVLAPPTTIAEAKQVAAEHLGFCPDNVGSFDEIPAYAEQLVDVHSWHFWWD